MISRRPVLLGKVAKPVSVRASTDCTAPVFSVTKHAGMVPSSEYFKKQVFSRDIEGYKVVQRGQFAYATIHLDEGSIGLLDTVDRAVVSPMYTVFETDSAQVYGPYLLRLLKSEWALSRYQTMGNGSVHRRRAISFEALEKLEIALPDVEEQKRIAAIFDKADSLRRKRQQAIRLADDLLRAVFLDLFGDPVTNPKGWPVKKLAEVGALDRGVSKHRPRNDPSLLGGKHPLIQTGEVSNCDGYIRSHTATYSDKGLAQSKLWPAGTLCITIAANIAKTGILMFDACFPDSVVGFSANNSATVEYVRFWLSFLQKTLEENAPESAQKNINLAILRDLSVPLPPLGELQRFEQIVTANEKLRHASRDGLNNSDALTESLQNEFFG